MNLILNLPPETEAKLKEQAAAVGRAPEEFVLITLEERLAAGSAQAGAERRGLPDRLAAEQWIARFRKWAESHRRLAHEADDSRESIYEGRGE